jgi:cGMP-dependent protein kinase
VLQGKEASTYWLVESGRLGVCVDGQPAAELAAGGSFGEIALLRSIRRTATVRTLTPCVLWALDRGPFLEAMQHSGVRGVMSDVANARLTRAAPAHLDNG